MTYLFSYAGQIFTHNRQIDDWLPLVHISILTFVIYTICQFLLTKRISKYSIYLAYFLYAVVLIDVLFVISYGLQGFELNPLSFINDFIYGSPFVVLMNLLLFLPLGFLWELNLKNVLLFVGFIFAVELAQFSFHLGFFDAGDIVLNTLGFILGSLTRKSKLFPFFQQRIY